ncbi:hypothetical protein D9615_007062 [Tricholomella constricta]|uniref:Uncharacterized protein n=1 Tax=Tricholomella constricta TaxID=117010 RepID=A0A8H5H894_9AGAR|nr:hypothetical protein D9615_007062 [Tricholomella constricta]
MVVQFLDETTNRLVFEEETQVFQSTAYLGGTALAFQSIVNTFNVSISGSSLALFGATFPNQHIPDTEPKIIIDGGEPTDITINERTSIGLLYRTPILPDTAHNITFINLPLLLDYMEVTIEDGTPLPGQRIIVDDDDTSITYTGNWNRSENVLIEPAKNVSRVPVGGATHHAFGASLVYKFNGVSLDDFSRAHLIRAGTSVSVFGQSNLGPGTVLIDYFLDGVNNLPPIVYGAKTPADPNFLWYSRDSLAPAEHTLEMKISGPSFTLDYFLYTPSSGLLVTQSGTPQVPLTSVKPSPRATETSTPSSYPSKSHHVLIGAIVGAAVGSSVVGVALETHTQTCFAISRTTRLLSVDPFPLPARQNIPYDLPFKIRIKRISHDAVHHQIAHDRNDDSRAFDTSTEATAGPTQAVTTPSRMERLRQLVFPRNEAQVVPFPLPTYREAPRSNLTVQRKPIERPQGTAPQDGDVISITDTVVAPVGESERVQHLQELVLELQREIAEAGHGQEHAVPPMKETPDDRVARSEGDADVRSFVASTLPPPYESAYERRSGILN